MIVKRRPRTVCPNCGAPARLTSARYLGKTWVPELGVRCPTTERRTECDCAGRGNVHVAWRVELYRGESDTWSVNLPGRRRPPPRR
jgi:hypothetical protein